MATKKKTTTVVKEPTVLVRRDFMGTAFDQGKDNWGRDDIDIKAPVNGFYTVPVSMVKSLYKDDNVCDYWKKMVEMETGIPMNKKKSPYVNLSDFNDYDPIFTWEDYRQETPACPVYYMERAYFPKMNKAIFDSALLVAHNLIPEVVQVNGRHIIRFRLKNA